jgi:zinc transport system substrate-binding protein
VRVATLLVLLFGLLLSSCGSSSEEKTSDKPTVTVAIPPQKYLLSALAADRFEINTLLPPGVDAESFEPSFGTMKSLMNSKAYFSIGSMPFEEQMLDKIKSNFPKLKIISPPSGLHLIYGSHGDAHHHHDGHECSYDPHYWTSVGNLRVMAADMARQLIELDSSAKDIYMARLKRLDADLAALSDSISSLLYTRANTEFLIWHPSLSYFAQEFKLSQIAVQHEGKEPSAAWLKHIYSLSRKGLSVFVVEPEHDARLSLSIAKEMEIPTCEISVMSEDINHQLLNLAYEIARK